MTVRGINPVFSQTVLHLSENGNEDVCKTDCARNAVVVFGSSGDFQFMYKDNVTIQSMDGLFKPLHIAKKNYKNLIFEINKMYIQNVDKTLFTIY